LKFVSHQWVAYLSSPVRRSQEDFVYIRCPTVTKRPPSCPSVRIQPSCANHPSARQLSAARSNSSSESVPSSALGYART